jgi:restriction endonuclease S subunit
VDMLGLPSGFGFHNYQKEPACPRFFKPEVRFPRMNLKKALMHKLFTEGTRDRPLKQTEIGPVPESWEIVGGSDAFEIQQGQVIPSRAPFSEMLHLGPENIESNTGRILELKTNSELRIRSGNYLFSADQIVYSKIRPYLNKVALPDFEGTCSADMYPLLPRKKHFTRVFLFQFFLSEQFVKQAASFQERTGIPKINRDQLKSIRFPKPSFEEQEQIAQILVRSDTKFEVHGRTASSLRELFRTLLHQLMTAKIRVHDLDLSALEEAAWEPAGAEP